MADLLRQERESDGPSFVWYVCLSPRHARAHRGHDIIAAIDSIGNDVAEFSGRQVRHPCCDHMDECAFEGSVVVRREVSVSMPSFCLSSHKQLEASISLEAMSTHGTAHLLRKFVASERC